MSKDLLTFDYNASFMSIYKRMFFIPMKPPFVIGSSTYHGFFLLYLDSKNRHLPDYTFFNYMCRLSGEITQSNYYHYRSLRHIVWIKKLWIFFVRVLPLIIMNKYFLLNGSSIIKKQKKNTYSINPCKDALN